jgi:hypothetical protein
MPLLQAGEVQTAPRTSFSPAGFVVALEDVFNEESRTLAVADSVMELEKQARRASEQTGSTLTF